MLPVSAPSSHPLGVVLLTVAIALAACGARTPDSLLASGKALAAKSDHKAAVIEFKSALQLNPRASEIRVLLGESLLASGDAVGAAVELNKALDDGAPAVKVLPLLSRAMVLTGDYRKLATTYGELKLDDPAAQAALKVSVATAWGALGDREKTESEAAAALEVLPDFAPGLLLKARILAGKNQYGEATAVVDGVLARDDKSYDAWLLRGELLHYGKGDTRGAEEAYLKAAAIEPANVLAHAAIISSRIRERDVEGARAQANKLRAAAPNHPHTALVDAQLAFLGGKFERGRELTQKLLRVVPNHAGVLILAGAIEFNLGAIAQAAAHFGKALQLYPSLDVVRLNLAETEMHLGQPGAALETLKPMLDASAPKAAALSLAGGAELRLGHPAAAEQYFLQAAKADPSNLRLQATAAMTRLWTGDGSAALTELQAISAKSKDTFADEALFAAHMKRREYEAALRALDTMSSKQPGKAALLELRGRVHLQRNDLAAARLAFEAAQKLEPSLTAAVVALADIDVREGKPDAALQRLQSSLKADARNAVVLMALAELKAGRGAPVEEVKNLLIEAVKAAPNVAEPRLRLIGYTLRKRLFKDALAAAQEATTAMPANTQVLQAVGRAQVLAGDLEQAANTFRKLAAAVPASPQPHMLLAEVYSAMGKPEQMETSVSKALEIDPSFVPAQTALVNILVQSKRQRSAGEYIARIRAGKPDDASGYALEAMYLARLKNTDAATKTLREGLARTNSPDLAAKLFRMLAQTGRMTEARQLAASRMHKHPSDLAFDYLLAEADIAGGDFAAAEKRLQRVIAALPGHAAALNNMAWVVLKTGGTGAVAFAQRAVDLVADRPDFMDTLAQALAADKQIRPALELQKKAVELAPADNTLRLNLARLAIQAGDKSLARQELTRLAQLGTAFKAQDEVASLLGSL